MSLAHLVRRYAPPSALALSLAGLAGLALIVGPDLPARAAEAGAKATAGFQTTEKLLLAVQVPSGGAADTLAVALVGPDGKVIAEESREVKPAAAGTSLHVELRVKGAPAGAVVRTLFAGKKSEVPLARILLQKAHETTLTGPVALFAGSQSALRCSVRGVRSLMETIPLPAEVVVRMRGPGDRVSNLYSGRTDAAGVADIPVKVPEVPAGTYKLEVVTKSAFGEETLQRDVRVQTTARVLLTADKPLYQPGQTMHLRALALRTFDLAPIAGGALTLEIEDGKGNKVFKKALETSKFGIASADFTLADEVNVGEYRLRAVLAEQTTEKTVTVQRYVLPKFRTELKADKAFYLPKETIKATLQVDYLFGKPVAKATVEVKASTFDVAFKDFTTWKGKTDESGHVNFEIKLPDYFVGTPLAKGDAIVKLEAKVTDTADHAETVTRTYPVSDQPIRVTLIPEGGRLVPGLENRLFAAALYPDGSPAKCTVDVHAGAQGKGKPLARLETGDNGLAEWRLTPKAEQFRAGPWQQQRVEMMGGTVHMQMRPTNFFDLTAEARDARGSTARTVVHLTSEPLGDNVLVRLDRAVYQGGDRMDIDVRTTAGLPTVYLDVVKAGQTMLTRWLDVKDGRASANLDLPAGVFGTLEVHAYQMLLTGEIIRDTRVVYVNQAGELKIKVSADRPVYQPGAEGELRFEVTDPTGKPAAAALGVLIVDEAVYALQEMQPGLEKVYFTLQQELLKPQAQAVYKPSEGLSTIVRGNVVPEAQQQVARALLTAAKTPPPGQWNVNPGLVRQQQVQARLAQLSAQVLAAAEKASKSCVVRDARGGKWTFAPDLLDQAVKAGNVKEADLLGVLSERLTLEDVARLDGNFTPERLAKAVTEVRLAHLMGAVAKRTTTHRASYFKDGKWANLSDLLADAAKDAALPGAYLVDGWGNKVKIVARTKPASRPFTSTFFNEHDLVSPGPDGKLSTDDDVTTASFESWMYQRWGRYAPAYQTYSLATRNNLGDLLGMHTRTGAVKGMAQGFPPPPPMAAERARARFDGLGQAQLRGPVPAGRPVPVKTASKRIEDPASKAPPAKGDGAGQPAAEPARLREYFPETLLWQPSLLTDEHGRATLKVPFADSITTWRLSASASSLRGALGGTSAPLRVFQDFFVDLDLPVALTQNDEVAFPVAVYNYLKDPQAVALELEEADWFVLADGAGRKRTLNLKAGEVTSVKFRIRARKVGRFPLTVKASSTKTSDAIRRSIEVLPDGVAVEQVHSDRLKGTVKHTITLPPQAIEGASRLLVKVYPGVQSQLMEGVDAMLRMPGGCFEQTSSSAYPNILVVDYLKRSRTGSPATLMKAEQFLNVGYQRLLTFERPGGGFDWWGSGEPLVWLSAYGLQEFNDMARVWPVDRGVIERTQGFLLRQQAPEGTWSKIGATHGESIERMGDPKLLLTSYVAWAMLDSMPKPAGWQKSEVGQKLAKAITYIREQAPKADNAYILALAANALASWDAKDDATFEVVKRVLRKLDEKKAALAEWKAINFPAGGQSLSYARGDSLTVETTALAVLAMLKSGEFTASVNQALTYLVKSRGAYGGWGSTQATILALKALLAGMGGVPVKGTTPFTVFVGGKEVASGKVTEANSDVMQLFDLRSHLKTGDNEVRIEVKGETSLMYQVVGRHFVPHRKEVEPAKPVLEVAVAYDRTKLTTKDLLKAKATLRYNGKVPTYQVIVDLPIPPGFTVDAGDFAEMVAAKKVQRFDVTARQVILYIGDVTADSERSFEYSLKPKYPIKAKAPAATAYEYYTPSNRATTRPVALVVEEK
jgi:hypothetical protein